MFTATATAVNGYSNSSFGDYHRAHLRKRGAAHPPELATVASVLRRGQDQGVPDLARTLRLENNLHAHVLTVPGRTRRRHYLEEQQQVVGSKGSVDSVPDTEEKDTLSGRSSLRKWYVIVDAARHMAIIRIPERSSAHLKGWRFCFPIPFLDIVCLPGRYGKNDDGCSGRCCVVYWAGSSVKERNINVVVYWHLCTPMLHLLLLPVHR